jgi:hypothetical protein
VKLLFTFAAFADVFSCEKIMKTAGLSCHVIPVPRSLGVACEYAAEIQNIDETDVGTVMTLLKKNDLSYTRVFRSLLTADGEIY